MAYAVIFAGGTGTRMKSTGLPKQFLEIEGRALIQHTLDPFLQSPRIDGIVIVSLESWIDHMRSLVKDLLGDKVIDVVPGGATGQLSIYAGLDRLRGIAGDDVVLIHDGVRPMIDVDLIDRCIASVEDAAGIEKPSLAVRSKSQPIWCSTVRCATRRDLVASPFSSLLRCAAVRRFGSLVAVTGFARSRKT